MKRKKQLLSWVLSFLMVFSIMPMMSISAFAETYDASYLKKYKVEGDPFAQCRQLKR